MRDRIIQLIALVLFVGASIGAGTLVPRLLKSAETLGLRYTADPIEGAPPIIALANSIGALRAIVADYMWIKLSRMKESGLFFEAKSLADWITKLQPRFPEVWAFHGHNMAYNISVMTHTKDERWSWVNQGIDLVRNQGLRYNPNDLGLNKELAFWFAHKIDGVSDDAHLHYKREFAREWQYLLGVPPYDQAQREAWIQEVADAPDTYEELVRKDPEVQTVVDRLKAGLSPFQQRFTFKLDKNLLNHYGAWSAIRTSAYARMLGTDAKTKAADPLYAAMSDVFADQALQKPIRELIAWLRKRVLLDDYNMDPAVMARYTKEFGPFDWRHPQAHAFYWAKRGAETGQDRYLDPDDISKALNNDRIWIQAIQFLERSGLMTYDPLSNDNPTRLNDPRWIKTAMKVFREIYDFYFDKSKGGGVDTFADWYKNFMTTNVRELWRAGDVEGAQEIYAELDKLFGSGARIRPNNEYKRPIEVFIQETTKGEYEAVPDTAATDVYTALRQGYIQAFLMGKPERLKAAREFARGVIEFYKSNRYFDFKNKFGEGRMADILADPVTSEERVFTALMLDTSISLLDRILMYRNAPEDVRRLAYDDIRDRLRLEIGESPIGAEILRITSEEGRKQEDAEALLDRAVADALPEPPGMEEWRQAKAERAKARDARFKEMTPDFKLR